MAAPEAMRTVADAMAAARALGVEALDAQLLLARALGRSRTWLIAHDDAPLDADAARVVAGDLAARHDDVPLAYLLGTKEFHGLALQVTRDVLVPRPDTEVLVAWALESLRARAPGARHLLDLGTGSGAIALAVARELPDATVTAVDRSEAALQVARDNGARLGLVVEWLRSDWWSTLPGRRVDVIVSNPPYIAEADAHLPALRHEPRDALVSGADGLDALREIVAGARAHLHRDGVLLLEHGHLQGAAVQALLAAGGFHDIHTRRDLAGHSRCTGGRLAPRL